MVLRPLVAAVLALVRVAKIVDLNDHGHIRFKNHGSGNRDGSVLLHLRFDLLTADELLFDQPYLEPSPAIGAASEKCSNFF